MYSHRVKSSRTLRRALGLILALSLLMGLCPPLTLTARAAESGMIRVRLTALGSHGSIGLMTTGAYTVNGTTIPAGSSVTATLSGSAVVVRSGGKTLATAPSVTLSRTSGGLTCGVRFTSPAMSNPYYGDLTFIASGGMVMPVLKTYIETYLYGVVPYEMYNSWHIEALKAQAVAARTYALRARKTSGNYDLTDSASSQVFRGYNAAYTNAINAVNLTQGQVLLYDGTLAQCYYTDSNGGQTESTKNAWSASIPYLNMHDDPYDLAAASATVKRGSIAKDGASLTSGVRSLISSAAASQLSAAGMSGASITSVNSAALHSPRYPEPSRTYTKLRLNVTFTKNGSSRAFDVDVATYGGLESTMGLSINSGNNEIVSVSETSTAFMLEFRRWGHGIGLSQQGAQQMASANGKSSADILSFYYPGTQLTTLTLTETVAGQIVTVTPAPTQEAGYTTLSYGSTGDAVRALQARLKELGYFTGEIGGNYLTLTETAVKAWQRANGYAQDGVATPEIQKLILGTEGQATGQQATVRLSNTSSKVNVRTGAGTGYTVVATLNHGQTVTVTATIGAWSAIRSGSVSGYVMTQYLSVASATATPAPTMTAEVQATVALSSATSKLNVRAAASLAGRVITQIPHGQSVTILSRVGDWSQIRFGQVTGYVASRYLIEGSVTPGVTPAPTQAPTPGPVVQNRAQVTLGNTSSRLNVRAAASQAAQVVGQLPHGAQVTVLEISGDWTRISSGTLTGWAASRYLSAISAPTAAPTVAPTPAPTATAAPTPAPTQATPATATVTLGNTSSSLNVRAAASTSANILTRLKHGTVVTVLGQSGGWTQIQSGSVTGWVSSEYLKFNAAVTPTAEPATSSYTTLKYGDTGEAVKDLQRKLGTLGYFTGEIGGNYLTLTESAVKAWQRANGYAQDGVATPEIQAKIFAQ